jgi:hypothetical protein
VGLLLAVRGKIWCKMLHDKLHLTPEAYHDFLEEAMRMCDSSGRLSLQQTPLDAQKEQSDFDVDVDLAGSGQDALSKSCSGGRGGAGAIEEEDHEEEEQEKAHSTSTLSGSGLSASSVVCQIMSSTEGLDTDDSFSDKPAPTSDRNSVGGSDKLDLLVASMTLIKRDIPRTFPTLSFFHDDGPLAASLDHVMKAYACYEPNIGYVQVRL